MNRRRWRRWRREQEFRDRYAWVLIRGAIIIAAVALLLWLLWSLYDLQLYLTGERS